jgi:hypothetical protein
LYNAAGLVRPSFYKRSADVFSVRKNWEAAATSTAPTVLLPGMLGLAAMMMFAFPALALQIIRIQSSSTPLFVEPWKALVLLVYIVVYQQVGAASSNQWFTAAPCSSMG